MLSNSDQKTLSNNNYGNQNNNSKSAEERREQGPILQNLHDTYNSKLDHGTDFMKQKQIKLRK